MSAPAVMCGKWAAAVLLGLSLSVRAGEERSPAGTGRDRVAMARQILEAAPTWKSPVAEEMEAVLVADEKDHGPAGNGLHDYPLWQRRWALLLGGRKASPEAQVNLHGPPSFALGQDEGAPGVRVRMAQGWPAEEMFQSARVLVAFCYLNWTGERLDRMRRYLEAGGGLVLIHSATWTKPQPSPAVAEVTGVGGFTLYRHGPVRLDLAAPAHPIGLGFPSSFTLENDESYWPPTPLQEKATLLATSVEEQGAKGSTPRAAQPVFWCYELGKGRVFGCVPGHCAATFDDPLFRLLLLRGIAWSAGGSPYRLDGLALRGVAEVSPHAP